MRNLESTNQYWNVIVFSGTLIVYVVSSRRGESLCCSVFTF